MGCNADRPGDARVVEANVQEQFKVRQKHPVTSKSRRRNMDLKMLPGPLNISGTNYCSFAVAPNGKPGIMMVETSAVSAQILAVDALNHRVTLLDPDGKKKTIKVSKRITNLDDLKIGDTVDMLMTDSTVAEIVT
jgi:hypothetical protein